MAEQAPWEKYASAPADTPWAKYSPGQTSNRAMTLQERSKQVYGFDDLAERGTLLPVGETQEGKFTFAVPQVAKDMAESFLLPGHVMQGGSYTPQDATRFTLDYLVPATSGRAPGTKAPTTKKQFIQDAPSTETLKAAALQSKAAATGSGVVVNAPAQNRLISQLVGIAERENVTPGLHNATVAVLKRLRNSLGKTPTVEQVVRQRQLLQAAAQAGNDADRAVVRMMLEQFDDFIDNLSPDDLLAGAADNVGPKLSEFRSLWSRAKKSEAIEGIVKAAETQASGFENGIRIGFRQLLKSPKRLRGFTQDEKQLMEQIAMGKGANLWKLLGKFGYGLRGNNMLGGTIGTAGGAALGGPAGAALAPMIGQAASKAAEGVTVRNAELARALAATGGQMPAFDSRYMGLINNLLTRRGGGPVAGAMMPQQPQQQGQTIRLPNGATVTLDPNIL